MSNLSQEKVLVTGTSGFIGSATARRLKQAEVPVVATARAPSKILEQELELPVSQLDVMQGIPDLKGIRTIVHAASPNDIRSRDDDGAIPLAVMGTRALIDRAAEQGVERFIFLSTIQVYGTELTGNVDETTPHKCETIYGLNHYLGEEVCRHYAIARGMNVVSLRPSNVYGVPPVSTVDRWTLVPMCFVREAWENGTLTLKSSGKQLRNFVSIDEVTDVIVRLLDTFPTGYSVINAGSSWRANIATIAEMVAEIWLRETGQMLPIDIQSDQPLSGNDFHYVSRAFPSALTPGESRQKMIQVIEGLIRLLTTNKQKESL